MVYEYAGIISQNGPEQLLPREYLIPPEHAAARPVGGDLKALFLKGKYEIPVFRVGKALPRNTVPGRVCPHGLGGPYAAGIQKVVYGFNVFHRRAVRVVYHGKGEGFSAGPDHAFFPFLRIFTINRSNAVSSGGSRKIMKAMEKNAPLAISRPMREI